MKTDLIDKRLRALKTELSREQGISGTGELSTRCNPL